MRADLVVVNASEILTCAGPAPRIGQRQNDAGSIGAGVIASEKGTIVFVGRDEEWRRLGGQADTCRIIDAAGGSVVPGFVDAHTHVVFAGDRRHELRRRLGGATYAQIAADGGGIVATVRATRAASVGELTAATRRRLDEMLRCGTTTCEAKSGYGLTTDSEVRMLRVLRDLDASHPIDISPTFMGAHEVPLEYRDRRGEYIRVVIDEMIPAVAREGLAEWCDVFCEAGVFTPDESTKILEAGKRAGLKPRVHADELAASGGSRVAAACGARSADHLIFVTEQNADSMARAGTVATLLPTAAFYLKLGRFAPARMLIGREVAVALATDVNPGGGFSPSMPFAMTLACFGMGLTFEEALVAATLNAACSIDRHDRVGSLEVGKEMDAVIVDGPAIDLIRVGAETVRTVIKRGRVVAER